MKKKVSGCACQGANIEKFIQPVILSILKKETLTGYGVVKKMQDYSMFRFEQPDIAGVYKYLKNMEAKGYLEQTKVQNNEKTAHAGLHITEAGAGCLESWKQTLRVYQLSITDLVRELD